MTKKGYTSGQLINKLREAGISSVILRKFESQVRDFSPRADTVAKTLSAINRRRKDLNGEILEFSSLFETVGSR